MNTDERAMNVLERANPVRPTDAVHVPMSADRYLENLQQRSSTVNVKFEEAESTRSRTTMLFVAASVVALVVAAIGLVIATRDDATVVDEPDPTVPPTLPTLPPATTTPPVDISEAQAVVDELFVAHNAGDTDAVMSLLADATFTFGGIPNPDGDPWTLEEVENKFAWIHGQGEVWRGRACELAEEQLSGDATLSCRWVDFEAIARAVGDEVGNPAAALVVVSNGQIDAFHVGHDVQLWLNRLDRPFSRWVHTHHPNVEGLECCEGDTRQESEQRGALLAEWAQEWAEWLDQFGCAPSSCSWPSAEWSAEYDDMCLALDPVGQPTAEFAEAVWFLPRPLLTEEFAAFEAVTELATLDRELAGADPPDERIAELQQQRLDAMIELGIDERCHPVVD